MAEEVAISTPQDVLKPEIASAERSTPADENSLSETGESGEASSASILSQPEPPPPPPKTGFLVRNRVTLENLRESLWTDEHEETLSAFTGDTAERLVVIYIDSVNGLTVSNAIPPYPIDELAYFVRSGQTRLSEDDFNSRVHYGTLKSNYTESLLRAMQNMYGPMFFQNSTWPESVRNDFSAHVHRFMSQLTDTRHKSQGQTILYIPDEGGRMLETNAHKNKELVQRLETSMIHWTRQIKELLSGQDATETAEGSGPLEEIAFWSSRCDDLSRLLTQLEKPGVQRVKVILEQAKSAYVAPFAKLARQIKDGCAMAQSNLRFLSLLKGPCTELASALPKDIPGQLPHLLSVIRVIWVNSLHYKSRERLTALFRKVSSEIIQRCCATVDLDNIFDGKILTSKAALKESIRCCESWKELYTKASLLHNSFSDQKWVLDQNSIFAQVDAFVQRCKDLLDVCESQIHFARWQDGAKTPLPCFHGCRGPEIARSLLEIEATFEKNLWILKSVKKTILDVKATSWHDDFNRFRTGVKDLEVMMQNVIVSAFETATTIQEGIELLDIFVHLSSRESIRRTIDKKTVEVWQLFDRELNAVKKEFNSKKRDLTHLQPRYAGIALWARLLKKRIDKSKRILDKASAFLPQAGVGDEVKSQYDELVQALEEFVSKMFGEWAKTVGQDQLQRLEVPLMARMTTDRASQMLDIRFDRSLLKLFSEIYYWERLTFEIPHYAAEVYSRREELRVLRENVLLVVRDYNRIICVLSREERGLFQERIKFLDRRIHPGFSKLTWASKGISDYFVNECRTEAAKVQVTVDNYKNSNQQIRKLCRKISELLLVSIDGKTVYKNAEFKEVQSGHRRKVKDRLRECHAEIVLTLKETYRVFRQDGGEVAGYWFSYTEKMDRLVEEAFRLNVKWSLQELSRAINGDGKTSPNALFKVQVVLKQVAKEKWGVDFSPTSEELSDMVIDVAEGLTDCFAVMERLPDILTRRRSTRDPVYVVIQNDEETKKVQQNIRNGLSSNTTHLLSYMKVWDSYREIWEISKDAFIRRYERLNPAISSFDADIQRYSEVSNNVQKEDTVQTIQFVQLDCSPLKVAAMHHCEEWQQKFTNLLREMTTRQLTGLSKYLAGGVEKLSATPKTLEELGESLTLLERLQTNLKGTESKFGPLHEQFAILDKHDVEVPEQTRAMLDALSTQWIAFQQCLIECEAALKKHKEKFKGDLIRDSEILKNALDGLVTEFEGQGPFTSSVTVGQAQEYVTGMRTRMAGQKLEESRIRRGLAIFKIEHPPSKQIQILDKGCDSLDLIWELVSEWEASWDGWKQCKFASMATDEMENNAQGMLKRCIRLARELKEKNWEILEHLRNRIDQFKRTMPLIQALKNPAMRDRHWNQLKDDIQKSFDHDSDSFTLEKIIELGLDRFGDQVMEISGAASKELSIEQALSGIKEMWEALMLDIGPYKDRGHFRLKGTDEIFQSLEDNQITLSTMKASRYVKAFEKEVDHWERTLSHILECIEMILTVQRQWMYLENIFIGEDIRKQLPMESATFDDVNAKWKTIMSGLNKTRNALKGTHQEGLLDTLNEMNVKLEEIQKSLDMYLETKRQLFPRFYFLSNDDLLEILGQSKNPDAVQPHLKKCFDNIVFLKLHRVRDKTEASTMVSADGEEVEFQHSVLLEGPVESWLGDVEKNMRHTLKEVLKACKIALKKQTSKRDKWVKDWPGQILITSSQIQWTADCTKALKSMKERGDKKGLKSMKKKQIALLSKFSEALRGNLTKLQRLKLVALVTIEVHARDVIDRLIKSGCNDMNAFEWLMQLRLYWDESVDDCIARQTNTQFRYGYEYLGNSGRLVITPLTDRCYMTLTTALHLHRGGSPKGPAGTGKTETVKDLGKALGAYVIVVNCSEGLDYKSMGRMFSGLAQTGAWGCFDEFNRINIEVLSVVAQQILSILQALTRSLQRFVFEGREISLVWSCGIFITMNPGYAGRTELPDNLKSMFRPISMMVPDSRLIAEIILFGEGFSNTKALANKVFTLYSLAVQQLSKQDHYDFGLRALVSVLWYAGRKRRGNPDMPEEEVLLLAMKDMNVAKLTSVDLPLFNGIVSDLFPGVETPVLDYSKMKTAISAELKKAGLQSTDITFLKIIQVFETKNSRHSTMIVGETGSGKSTTWRTLRSALTRLHKEHEEENRRERKDTPNPWTKVYDLPINPKAVSLGDLYGEFDLNTNEWTDGILSAVMRQACADEKPDQKWLLFDAPVDTLWIESMNSVMDDNKILTLINGERISMPNQVSLLFETQDLAVASPATVSRCGMVYLDSVDLGWRPYVASWLEKRKDKESVEHLQKLFDKFVDKLLYFRRRSCKELVETAQLNSVISLCKLFDALATPENGVTSEDSETFARMIELWFLFSMIWSICASVDESSRKKMDNYVRELEGQFPSKDTVYEYYVDVKQKGWALWEQKLHSGWRYNPSLPFYKIIVPTVDTVRYDFLVHSLISAQQPVLLVGPVGTGKTSVVQSVLGRLDPRQYCVLVVNMSAQTSSNNVQEIIESKVEKRTKGVFVPVGGKKMLTFLDDLNMPAKDTFGSQPPLELLRMWLDYRFWYDRQKQTKKEIRDMFLLAAMGPPGGGRQVISRRFQSRFNLINMTFPHESQIKRIFGTMINQKLQDFEEDVKPIGDIMTQATVEIYDAIVARMLPTPTKIHYLFNLRDISKVFQGLLRAHKDYHDTKASMTRLWIHECFRVFSDRLVDDKDQEAFKDMLNEKLGTLFEISFHNLCPNKQSPVFADFLKQENPIYEDVSDFRQLKTFMENALEDYNMTPGVIAMDLVLFRDAIDHVCRAIRVIRQQRGNVLLIGIGGSGRQSLSRLASSILEYRVFQIEVSRHYRRAEFRDDLKKLYFMAGVENKPTVFLFTDTQVVEESFLEDINNILSSGEVPNLYKPDELEEVRTALADDVKKSGISDQPDSVFAFLIERVRNNLHVVLCMSPVGEAFRNRIRQYPAFVNCTTIDWFSEWPKDALLEVSEKYLEEVNLGEGDQASEMKKNAAQIFVTVHRSVVEKSNLMFLEMRRHNYVTPTNYLELVSGYKRLLDEKRKELGDAATKLKNGLLKLDDTRKKVEAMSIELEDAKVKVAEFQKQCEEYLVVIVQQKREADEQQKAVSARSEKIADEEADCKKIAGNAQQDLEAALPALEEAVKALEALNKRDLTEIKSYGNPPELVGRVMRAVMILRGADPSWAEAKRQLGDPNFIKQLIHFDKENMSDRVLKKISQYTSQPDFEPATMGRVSQAAQSLCMWVCAMEVYGRVFRVIEPKRQRLSQATHRLEKTQAELADAKGRLQEVQDRIEDLKKQYDEKLLRKEELRRKAELTELKLERAGKLVSGLAGERERWKISVADLEEKIGYLVGDCLIASACLSYTGPFLSEYREDLVEKVWLTQVRKLNVPCNPDFSFSSFLAKPTTVREWNIQGLPSDSFSTENGVIVTRGSRWPLMIDPQGQAIKWVKNTETKNGLKIIDLQQHDFLRTLENAIQFGSPVLLQNVQEVLDPSLAPILNKSIIKQAGRMLIRLGDKEVEYNPDFRFYITTKLSNPHYTPEISTKTTIVNFAVKEQGLEAQLLGIVVRKERPELEEQKDKLVLNIASGKRKLEELEDEILRLLSTAQGSLLDDEKLVDTLQTSKTTALEVSEQLQISEQTEAKIDAAREGYRACAQRASILFFVLNDMGRIDPMYQFSLDAYIELFNMSIEKSQKSSKLEERIKCLNEYHTFAVYKYTCRGLFERHKLLFSFQMCAKIMEAAGKLNIDEYNFFLRGGMVLDREAQMDNPCPDWLPDTCWDNATELDKLGSFQGLANSFEQNGRSWKQWYTASQPESAPLPGEWENSLNELQRMLIVRSLRSDRVQFTATSFIVNNLGPKFVEPPVLDMKSVVDDSTSKTPLIFVLSPGVDPTTALLQLSEQEGMKDRFQALSLGQGQAPIATRMLKEGVREGHWVFLANCHLSLSWMPQLDKLVEQLQVEIPHKDFRLWLSSSPNPDFPIAILQSGIKMTTEPPKGLKANMKRLYQLMTDDQFVRCHKQEKYKKLLFSLSFFHSVLIERRKFGMLGWNVIYGFNDSDFEVSENLISIYLDEYEETPWDALKYLIAGVNYGGHVTDDWDRRLLLTYINDLFCDATLEVPFFKLSSLPTYYIPRDGPLTSYKEYVNQLPAMDHPEAFGQHPNADISSQIRETKALFGTLLSLQPQVTVSEGVSSEDKVLELSAEVLKGLPEEIDYEQTAKLLADDPSPLNVVLLQEIERYNALLVVIRSSLVDLEKAIKGLVVMSSDLEETFSCIHDARVPPLWEKAYPSHKPLGPWTRDLQERVELFADWAKTMHPPHIFWMSGFTFPTGFLTAVLQTAARQNNVSVDALSWEFHVSTLDDSNITGPPKDGVWVKGLSLEGAGWDKKNSYLIEAHPMQLVCPMPSIHFKPVENKKKAGKGIYTCPCYYYSNRSGAGRPSYVVAVDLKVGGMSSDHWIKRAVALLMSLDY